jgi:hypothetical protein
MAPSQRTKRNGALTEPRLPPRTILQQDGVTIEQFYSSRGDHAPPHLHVSGPGDQDHTRIGQKGHPLEHDPPLTANQMKVVQKNRGLIRRVIRKIGRWYWFQQQ